MSVCNVYYLLLVLLYLSFYLDSGAVDDDDGTVGCVCIASTAVALVVLELLEAEAT